MYLRNGSNQWLNYPQKDATQVSIMSKGTNNYYSAMEPVSVYINGAYFGLYELREKFNTEYFDEREDIDKDSIEILSMSYFL
ncbi:MAG: CotH kinase family protein [Bacteroidetes bacterium]|nr:CotH kinase family protein [Bacteroidota bacterium]